MTDATQEKNSDRSGLPGADGARKVFISHASQDCDAAARICAALEAADLPCWIAPRDVSAGEPYAAAILNGINSCKIMVLILSQSAIDSPHVLREVERASSKRRPVMSIRTDASELPPELEYFLSSNQWLDTGGGPVERILPALIEALRGMDTRKTGRDAVGGNGPAPPRVLGSPSRREPYRWGARALVLMLAVTAAGLAYVLADKFWLSKHSGTARRATAMMPGVADKSIAVLPFVDMSEKKDQEYFSDGMAEEILSALAKIDGLKVAGRTSSFSFKGRATDLKAIGTALGVANILEGSVRKQGERVRITAQLLRADTGFHIWSETYDGRLADIFDLQERIAREIAGQLKILLALGDTRLVAKATGNSAAYTLFVEALELVNRRLDLPRAITLLDEATTLDPQFARAWAKLAVANVIAPQYSTVAWKAAWVAGEAAARRALTLDPTSAESYAALGYMYLSQRNFVTMADSFDQALALNHGDPVALYWASNALAAMGHTAGAESLVDQILRTDPVNALALQYKGLARFSKGDLATSRKYSLAGAATGLKISHIPLSQAEAAAGAYEAATADFTIGFGSINTSFSAPDLAEIFRGSYGDATSRAAALALVDKNPQDILAPTMYLFLSEPARAFSAFERMGSGLSDAFFVFLWQPSDYSRKARQHLSFQVFAKRLGMIDYWRKYGWPDLCRPAPTRGADAFECD